MARCVATAHTTERMYPPPRVDCDPLRRLLVWARRLQHGLDGQAIGHNRRLTYCSAGGGLALIFPVLGCRGLRRGSHASVGGWKRTGTPPPLQGTSGAVRVVCSVLYEVWSPSTYEVVFGGNLLVSDYFIQHLHHMIDVPLLAERNYHILVMTGLGHG